MVRLSVFLGQILSDIANARTQTDSYAASTSELYHADPFVKNLPIPHYIIESAELDVPLIVVGIDKSEDEFAGQCAKLYTVINEKLPLILMRNFKYSYARKKESENAENEEKSVSEEKLRLELSKEERKNEKRKTGYDCEFSDAQLNKYRGSTVHIAEKVVKSLEKYLDAYNYDIVKILDLTDEFISVLEREIKADTATYEKDIFPYADLSAIKSAANYIGNIMFFEFKKIMRSSAAVQVDASTVHMNEYSTKDCLMHIRLKIKEQDLSLLVEEEENGRERRFLSLS